jgi:hypothetical protein
MLESLFSSKLQCLPIVGENVGIEDFGINESRCIWAGFQRRYMVPLVSDMKIKLLSKRMK